MLEHLPMQLAVISPASDVQADLRVVALTDNQELAANLADAPGAADVRTAKGKATVLRPGADERVLVLGLGPAAKLDAEGLRVAAARAAKQAKRFDAVSIAWELPASETVAPDRAAAAIVEGTVLAGYRFDRFRGRDEDDPDPVELDRIALVTDDGDAVEEAARVALASSEGANRARELQNLPANVATPSFLAGRAREIAEQFASVEVDVLGREQMAELGMGGLVAVAKGTAEEPQLIVLRYSGSDSGERLGLVGKAVTFDTGGISIKPSAKMEEMKMDMSGGAAVLEAIASIAELELPIDLVAAIPSTENMPSGTATRPGDIITQLNGKTVEVNNTDAEGRLILADALTYTVRELGRRPGRRPGHPDRRDPGRARLHLRGR